VALEQIPQTGYFLFMPIYEFHCEKCERDSEILVRSSDWRGAECPHCGSKKLSKKFSTFTSAGAGSTRTASSGNGGGGGHCCGGGCSCH
jgi:putative FmdB family regulatory protein